MLQKTICSKVFENPIKNKCSRLPRLYAPITPTLEQDKRHTIFQRTIYGKFLKLKSITKYEKYIQDFSLSRVHESRRTFTFNNEKTSSI